MAEEQGSSRASRPAMLEIADKTHDARVVLGWTQRDLARHAEVSRPTVARIERGDDVSTATLAKVAAALGLKVELTGEQKKS